MKPFLTLCFFFYYLVGGFAQSKGKNDCNLASHAKDADNSCYVSQLLSAHKIKKRVKVVSIPENEGNPTAQYTTLLEIETYNEKGKVVEKSWKMLLNNDEKEKKHKTMSGRIVHTYQSDTILLEAVTYNGAEDTVFEQRSYFYDDLGRLKMFNSFLKKLNGKATVKFYYDKYNRVIKSISYPVNPKFSPVKATRKYNCEERKVIRKSGSIGDPDHYAFTYIYNENNLLAEYHNKNKTDAKKYFYDATGRIIKTVKQFPMEKEGNKTQLIITSVITYNDLGLIEKIEDYEKDVITQTTRFMYEN